MPIDPSKSTVQNTGTEFTLIDEGMYTVQVVDIDLKEKVKTKFGVKDKFYFKLGILDEENRGLPVFHFTTTAYNSGFDGGSASKLYETACAIMGEKLDDSLPIDVNTLIGGRFRIVVKHQGGEDGKAFANITEVMKIDANGKKLAELTKDELEKMTKKSEDSSETTASTMTDEDLDTISKEIGGSL